MWEVIGNSKAVNFLKRSVDSDKTSHAYLISGPPNVGKMRLAIGLAKAMNCLDLKKPCFKCEQCRRIEQKLHADVRVIGLDSDGASTRTLVGIEKVREVQREASLKPYEGFCRVFIFESADRLSEEAANCLLKTLEEPPDQVVLLLLVTGVEVLMPTLVSRCHVVDLRLVSQRVIVDGLKEKFGLETSVADELARLSGGRPGWAIEASKNPDILNKRAQDLDTIESVMKEGMEKRFAYASDLAGVFVESSELGRQKLALWLDWWRDVMLVGEGTPYLVINRSEIEVLKSVAENLSQRQILDSIRIVIVTIENLERNVNPRLAIEHMMLGLPRL